MMIFYFIFVPTYIKHAHKEWFHNIHKYPSGVKGACVAQSVNFLKQTNKQLNKNLKIKKKIL